MYAISILYTNMQPEVGRGGRCDLTSCADRASRVVPLSLAFLGLGFSRDQADDKI